MEAKKNEITPTISTVPAPLQPNVLQLGNSQQIDMSSLTEQQQSELRMRHATAMLELSRRAHELQIDVGATSAHLATMTKGVEDVSASGNAVTMTHVQKTTLGNTEIMMGNTETAQKGKLSRAQRGESDRTLWYIMIGAAVLIVIALAFAR